MGLTLPHSFAQTSEIKIGVDQSLPTEFRLMLESLNTYQWDDTEIEELKNLAQELKINLQKMDPRDRSFFLKAEIHKFFLEFPPEFYSKPIKISNKHLSFLKNKAINPQNDFTPFSKWFILALEKDLRRRKSDSSLLYPWYEKVMMNHPNAFNLYLKAFSLQGLKRLNASVKTLASLTLVKRTEPLELSLTEVISKSDRSGGGLLPAPSNDW